MRDDMETLAALTPGRGLAADGDSRVPLSDMGLQRIVALIEARGYRNHAAAFAVRHGLPDPTDQHSDAGLAVSARCGPASAGLPRANPAPCATTMALLGDAFERVDLCGFATIAGAHPEAARRFVGRIVSGRACCCCTPIVPWRRQSRPSGRIGRALGRELDPGDDHPSTAAGGHAGRWCALPLGTATATTPTAAAVAPLLPGASTTSFLARYLPLTFGRCVIMHRTLSRSLATLHATAPHLLRACLVRPEWAMWLRDEAGVRFDLGDALYCAARPAYRATACWFAIHGVTDCAPDVLHGLVARAMAGAAALERTGQTDATLNCDAQCDADAPAEVCVTCLACCYHP
jgi:hypothetical protein